MNPSLLHLRKDEGGPAPARAGVISGSVEGGNVARRELAMPVMEALEREADLLEVVLALGPRARLPGGLYGRQQETDKRADDRDHDQQFDERERPRRPRSPSDECHGVEPGERKRRLLVDAGRIGMTLNSIKKRSVLRDDAGRSPSSRRGHHRLDREILMWPPRPHETLIPACSPPSRSQFMPG